MLREKNKLLGNQIVISISLQYKFPDYGMDRTEQ